MRTILCVIGTRPEAIKMAPVIQELRSRPGVRTLVCATGQHRELVEPILEAFQIRPEIELAAMRPGQSLADLTATLLRALDAPVAEIRPDWILAQGDTTSVLAASLVAFYRQVPFGHVEAGLRTGDLTRPFPEEANRRVADQFARLLFAPTQTAASALRGEGYPEERIVVTGNTVIDALRLARDLPYDRGHGPLAQLPLDRRLVLVTAHRRESFGEPLRQVCTAVRDLARAHGAEGVHFVYPVHLNPNARTAALEILSGISNVTLTEPLDYLSMVHLLGAVELILTDSGGLQEEAAALRVPTLVLRDATERTEGVESGLSRLVGTDRGRIVAEADRLLREPALREAMRQAPNPYGDGFAGSRIVDALLRA